MSDQTKMRRRRLQPNDRAVHRYYGSCRIDEVDSLPVQVVARIIVDGEKIPRVVKVSDVERAPSSWPCLRVIDVQREEARQRIEEAMTGRGQ